MNEDPIATANALLRERGYGERDLAAFPTPHGAGRAILKGAKILSPFSDDATTILRVVRDLVPPAAELKGQLRAADLRRLLG